MDVLLSDAVEIRRDERKLEAADPRGWEAFKTLLHTLRAADNDKTLTREEVEELEQFVRDELGC